MTSPFVINIHDLSRRPGSMREIDVSVTLAEPLGTDVIAIPAGAPLDLELRLESVSEGVLVTGTAAGTAAGECVRCLRELSQAVDVDITELFAYEDNRSRRTAEEGEEEPLPVLDGDLLDLETTVTDAVVTSLPFQPVCTPDCAGLCSECGVRLDDAEPGHSHEILDPRWAALSGLGSTGDEGDDAAEEAGGEPR